MGERYSEMCKGKFSHFILTSFHFNSHDVRLLVECGCCWLLLLLISCWLRRQFCTRMFTHVLVAFVFARMSLCVCAYVYCFKIARFQWERKPTTTICLETPNNFSCSTWDRQIYATIEYHLTFSLKCRRNIYHLLLLLASFLFSFHLPSNEIAELSLAAFSQWQRRRWWRRRRCRRWWKGKWNEPNKKKRSPKNWRKKPNKLDPTSNTATANSKRLYKINHWIVIAQ